jgi:hypothetical protein
MHRAIRLFGSVSLVAALVALLAPATLAAPPLRSITTLDPFVNTSICGFPILVSFEGDIRIAVYLDRNGKPLREIDTFPNFDVTFSHDGQSLSTKGPAHVIVRFAPDGSIESIEQDGMSAAIALPGQGVVFLDAGRIAWDGAGNLITEEGIHQAFGTAAAPKFCAAMA